MAAVTINSFLQPDLEQAADGIVMGSRLCIVYRRSTFEACGRISGGVPFPCAHTALECLAALRARPAELLRPGVAIGFIGAAGF
jgi:hypothetical protein